MKSLLIITFLTFAGFSAHAEVNFECDIFSVVGGGFATGTFTLSGEQSMEQSYELILSDDRSIPAKKFDGTVYLKGQVDFTELDMLAQEAIISAMKNSKRPALSTGPLVLFSNVQDNTSGSTLNVYLMPSGEIGYIEAGFLPVLCM